MLTVRRSGQRQRSSPSSRACRRRHDIQRGVHVRVARVSAMDALEFGLRLAARRINPAAAPARLAGVHGRNSLDMRRLVLKHPSQLRPAGIQDCPVESRFLPDVACPDALPSPWRIGSWPSSSGPRRRAVRQCRREFGSSRGASDGVSWRFAVACGRGGGGPDCGGWSLSCVSPSCADTGACAPAAAPCPAFEADRRWTPPPARNSCPRRGRVRCPGGATAHTL